MSLMVLLSLPIRPEDSATCKEERRKRERKREEEEEREEERERRKKNERKKNKWGGHGGNGICRPKKICPFPAYSIRLLDLPFFSFTCSFSCTFLCLPHLILRVPQLCLSVSLSAFSPFYIFCASPPTLADGRAAKPCTCGRRRVRRSYLHVLVRGRGR